MRFVTYRPRSLPAASPLIPGLAVAGDVIDLQAAARVLEPALPLNGEIRQNSDTSDLLFSVEEIVAYVSRVMILEPGDLICTGTPEGVVLGMEENVWLAPGDVYEIEIGPLGRLETQFVSEAEPNG